MLTKIVMKNFRKHENTEMDFTEALNVIRGANEKGKSTIGEALLYTLYGAKSLRGRFDDVVTWGKPSNTLKVEAHLLIQGVNFKFVRSKGGAELYKGEDAVPFITGQTEVSDFATQLIGADAVTARKLMFANQGNMRGALEVGPKATAEMVEELSDFSFFEDLLEAMSQKLALGSNVIAKSRLEAAQDNLAELLSSQGEGDDDLKKAENRIKDAEENLKTVRSRLETLQTNFDKAKIELEISEERQKHYDSVVTAVEEAKEAYDLQLKAVEKEKAKIVEVDTSNLASLRERIQQADSLKTIYQAYEKFSEFADSIADKTQWIHLGSMEELERKIEEEQEKVNKTESNLNEVEALIKSTKQRIITDTTCNHCGQPIKNVDEVLANNKVFEAQVAEHLKTKTTLEEQLNELKLDLKRSQNIKKSNQPVESYLRTESSYVEVDYEQVPYKVTWKGAIPTKGENVDDLKQQVSVIEGKLKLVEIAKTRFEVLSDAIEPLKHNLETAKNTLNNTPRFEYGKSPKKAFQEAEDKLLSMKMEEASLEHAITTNKETISTIKASQAHFNERKIELQQQIESFEKEVQDLAFNNALLKKVREARPMVANQLWNLVLSSVSTMFTKVRGVKSTVTKAKEGFLVNGESVDGLSGSTLDLLGLSIRCSLIKLFIPNCPFLILDEPAAAMDIERTASMMGFISSLDFPQTIVITHEDLSETLASNLVEI